MSYDSWKTTPDRDKRDEYACGRLDKMTVEEIIKKASDLGLLKDGPIFEAINQAIYDHFYNLEEAGL